MEKTKVRYKIKWFNLFLVILIEVLLLVYVYSLINITIWNYENYKTKNEINIINNIVIPNNNENENNNENNNESKEIDLNNINFDELKKMNDNVVGWIEVKGTNINYPFVQTSDNSFYLNHSFDKTKNNTGWLFLDYRNNNEEFDKNNIIYGHNIKSGYMFGTLNNILLSSWQSNSNYHVITIAKEKSISYWQTFSVYTVPSTTDYIEVNFQNNNDFINFTNLIKNRSKYNFNVPLDENDKILTLSTCYKDSSNRTVLHAKLIKEEFR